MTKKDIAQVVAQRADVSATAAEEIIGAALDVIGEQLAKGEDVRLAGLRHVRDPRARGPHRPQPADRRRDRHRRVDLGRLQGCRAAQARGQRLTPEHHTPTGRRPLVGAPSCPGGPVAPPRPAGRPASSRSQEHFAESGRIRP